MRKCIICDQPATVSFGADPDLQGVPSCDQCKDKVRIFMCMLWCLGEKEADRFLNDLKKKLSKEKPI